MMLTVASAAALLHAAEDILVLTHRRPDGDTTGCAGALCRGLRQMGKRAYVLENPEVTARYAPLIAPLYAQADWTPRFIITVDIADAGLLPANAAAYADKIDLVIDHHRSNAGMGKANLVRAQAGACAEIVYDVLMAMGVRLDIDIAHALYIGLSTDTGCFRFSNTAADTLRAAAACLEAGVDGGEINRALFEVKSRPRIEMERIILGGMEYLRDGKIALATLHRKDIDRAGADMDDLDSIAALPRQIEGVQVGITLTENQDGTVKASVRTTKEVDASAICQRCGGGGHLRAGGASFPLGIGLDEARACMLQAVQEEYNESSI